MEAARRAALISGGRPLAATAPVLGAAATGLVLALLVPVLTLDPARGVTFSDSPFTDEAWYVLNARNLVLFGRWSTDDWNLHLVTPVYAGLQAGAFSLLGVGILQARLVVAVITALTCGLLAAGLRPHVGGIAALVAAIGFATSGLVLYYGRLGYAELLVGAGLLVAALCAAGVAGPRPGAWGAVAGVALAISAGAKPIALGAVLGLLLAVLVFGRPPAAARRWVAGALLVLAIATVAWLILIWLPAGDGASAALRTLAPQAVPPSPAELVGRIVGYLALNDDALGRSAPLVVGAAAGLAVAIAERERLPAGTRLVALAAAGLVLGGLAVILMLAYRPNRYVVPLLPGLAILTAVGVDRLLHRWARRGPGARLAAAGVIALLLAAPGLAPYSAWIRDGTTTLVGVEARARDLLAAGDVVQGAYAPAVALSAPVTVLISRPESGINPGDLYLERGVRFVVAAVGSLPDPAVGSADAGNPPAWSADHPQEWAAREHLVCFGWGRSETEVCLDRLP